MVLADGRHDHQRAWSDALADRRHAGVGQQSNPAIERQQHADHGEANAEILMVERQHGIQQRVTNRGDGDHQSRQCHADRHDAGR